MSSTLARVRRAPVQELLLRRSWLYLRWGVVLCFMAAACGGGGCFGCLGCPIMNLACQACPVIMQGCQACPAGGCDANGLGGFPQQQRIQNAAQIRLTPEGLAFIGEQIPDIAAELVLGDMPVCIPAMDGEAAGMRYRACGGDLCGAEPGCRVDLAVDTVRLRSQAIDPGRDGRERAGVWADVTFRDVSSDLLFQLDDGSDCALELRATRLPVSVPVALATPEPTRELSLDFGRAEFDLDGVGMRVFAIGASESTCRRIDGQLNSSQGRAAVVNMVQTFMRESGPELLSFVEGVRCRTCDDDRGCLTGGRCDAGQCVDGDHCQTAPLGVGGELAIGELLPGVAPGNDAVMRLLAAFGGHVDARDGGLSIGLIGGATSRRHTVTSARADTALLRLSGAKLSAGGRLEPGATTKAELHVDAPGVHRIRVELAGENASALAMRAALRVDGETVEVVNVTADATDPQRVTLHVQLAAGTHEVGVRFLDEFRRNTTGVDQAVVVSALEVEGPLEMLEGAHPCVTAQPRPPIVEGTRSPALAGNADPKGQPYHFALSIGQPWIDQHMWAAYDSGALCLGVSSHTDEKLRLLGANIPGLKRLTGSDSAPIAVTLSPRSVPRVSIGDHLTEIDDDGAAKLVEPLATFELPSLWVDFHTLVEDRWVRIFSVQADVTMPTGLGFTPDDTFRLAVGDLRVENVRTENGEILGADLAALEASLPGVLGPLIGGFADTLLAPVQLPAVLGFGVDAQNGLLVGVDEHTSMGLFFDLERRPVGGSMAAHAHVETEAELLELHVPDRATWAEDPPYARLRLDAYDGSADDGTYAFSWRIGQGAWSPFTTAREVTLRRAELLWQGRHRVEVQARREGDYRSLDPTPATVEIIVDVQPPEIDLVDDGGSVAISARDHVSPASAIRLEWRASEAGAWSPLDEGVALGSEAVVAIRAVDEAGNVSERRLEGALHVAPAEVAEDDDVPPACSAVPGRGGQAPWAALLLLCAVGMRRRGAVLLASVVVLAGCGEGTLLTHGLAPAPDETPAGGADPDRSDETCGADCRGALPPTLEIGLVGRYHDFVVADGSVQVAGYAEDWGDLVFGAPEADWTFVDGVPEGPVEGAPDGPRAGVSGAGEDVGRHVRMAAGADGALHVAYHDATHDALKYARRDGEVWTTRVVDEGGLWLDLALTASGPAILYRTDGEVRLVRTGDDGAFGAPIVLDVTEPVDATGLGVALTVDADGEPVAAWYDPTRESVRVARRGAVETVAEGGGAFVDAGIDARGRLHLCFQDANTHGLRYLAPEAGRDEWVDDGVREGPGRGLESHLVGADCALRFDADGRPLVVYQDATGHALLVARRGADGVWTRTTLRGDAATYDGSHGFATRAAVVGEALWVSHLVLDPAGDHLEVLRAPLPTLGEAPGPDLACRLTVGTASALVDGGFARVEPDAPMTVGLDCEDAWAAAHCDVLVGWAEHGEQPADGEPWACPSTNGARRCVSSQAGGTLQLSGALEAGDTLSVAWRCEDAGDPARAAAATAALEAFLGWAPRAEAPADGAAAWAACPARSQGAVDGAVCVGSRGDGRFHRLTVPAASGVLGVALSSRG